MCVWLVAFAAQMTASLTLSTSKLDSALSLSLASAAQVAARGCGVAETDASIDDMTRANDLSGTLLKNLSLPRSSRRKSGGRKRR